MIEAAIRALCFKIKCTIKLKPCCYQLYTRELQMNIQNLLSNAECFQDAVHPSAACVVVLR